MKAGIIILILAIVALVLIGVGAWLIYRPAAFIVIGGLLWIDLSLIRRGRTRSES